MTDLIIKGAKGIKDGLYVIKDGELFKYKPNRNTVYTVRSYHITDRPKGEWIHTPNEIDRDFVWWTCSECGHKIFSETEKDRIEFHAYCGRCGAEMRGEDE